MRLSYDVWKGIHGSHFTGLYVERLDVGSEKTRRQDLYAEGAFMYFISLYSEPVFGMTFPPSFRPPGDGWEAMGTPEIKVVRYSRPALRAKSRALSQAPGRCCGAL